MTDRIDVLKILAAEGLLPEKIDTLLAIRLIKEAYNAGERSHSKGLLADLDAIIDEFDNSILPFDAKNTDARAQTLAELREYINERLKS